MKVGIMTLGCKVNTYESEYVMSLLKENQYEITPFDEICDIYIINTCTVTNQSDSKSRKMIHQARRRNPEALIIAMGCFIEANKESPMEEIDILIGNKDKSKIVELIREFQEKKEPLRVLYSELGTEFENMEIRTFEGRTRAFVKIQDGCENFCSYCIIPFVRGKCRSKKKEHVIKEVETLVHHGYQEIVLTGIHTGNYGTENGTSLAELLKELLRIEDLYRLRISSIEITELNEEILDLLKNSKVIADHLHIPLQAGSDTILKKMNRKYDTDYFRKKIAEIRSIRSDISITTDVIVGFPGETEELFEETYQFCKEMRFAKLHVFPYSIRANTAASKFKDQIDPSVKKERARRLIALSKQLEISYMEQFIEKEQEVLIETSKDGWSQGHTSNYLLLKTQGTFPSEERVKVIPHQIEYPYLISKTGGK